MNAAEFHVEQLARVRGCSELLPADRNERSERT